MFLLVIPSTIGASNDLSMEENAEEVELLLADDYGNSFASAHNIPDNISVSGTINSAGDLDFFRFYATKTGQYTIETTGPTNTYGMLYNNSQAPLASNDNISSSNLNFRIKYNLVAGNYYYIRVSHSTSGIGSYTLNVLQPLNVSVQVKKLWIPQNKDGVSTPKWTIAANATYDYNSTFRPYSNWAAADFTNSTGKVTTTRGWMLKQAEVEVTVTRAGSPVSGHTVTLTSSLGTNAFIKNPTVSTNSSGKAIGYIEFYGEPTFTITGATDVFTGSTSYSATGEAEYRNKFYLTQYYTPLRSKFSSDTAFRDAVNLNGSGYNDITGGAYAANTWYRFSCSGCDIVVSAGPVTFSGTTPTEYRTMAVNINSGSAPNYGYYVPIYRASGSSWYRGKVRFEGLTRTGDAGYRTAEDRGGSILGYHVDIFLGFTLPSQFNTLYPNVAQDTGKHFVKAYYQNILPLGGV